MNLRKLNRRPKHEMPQVDVPGKWPQFWRLFLPLLLLLVVSGLFIGWMRMNNEVSLLKAQEEHLTAMASRRLAYSLNVSFNHLQGLINNPEVMSTLLRKNQPHTQDIETAFKTIIYGNQRYDHLRWIDAQGAERVRVNNVNEVPQAAPKAQLQNKSDRDYFSETMQLPAGHIFVSRMDLNVEHNQLERPLKPVIRIAIRLAKIGDYDPGLFICNLKLDYLIDALKDTIGVDGRLMLLNPAGYWVHSPNTNDEWGFLLGHQDTTLAKRSPVAWHHISAKLAGSSEFSDGLWTWDTLANPLNSNTTIHLDESVLVVTHVPSDILAQLRWQVWAPILAVLLSAIILSVFVVFRYVSNLFSTQAAMLELNQALRIQTENAEQANLAKSQFLSNMTHELRTPLNAIMGFSNLMISDASLSESQTENLSIINRSGEHLLCLINDVLDMAKIEAGHIHLNPTAFDFNALLEDVVDMMRIRSADKGLQLLVEQTPDQMNCIKADADKLRQILVNLLSNAIKYTQHGGVSLRVNIQTAEETLLYIDVEDSGIGINPTDQTMIFEPFKQVGKVSSQKGTGLGLALVKQYVELMGGNIQLQSELDKGSIFRVVLPVALADADEVTVGETRQPPVIGLQPGQPEYRVLIVEDQEENWLLLQRLLQNVGFKVEIAKNGEEAIDLFQRFQPQFIWMDRRMPVMDGVEATRRIRALENGKTVIIAAVTASAFLSEREEIMAVGMNDFIRKPYRPAEIYDCMAKHLGVRFVYQTVAEEVSEKPMKLSFEGLVKLPEALRQNLADALILGDGEQLDGLIKQIEQQDPALAGILKQHIARFNYLIILDELEKHAISQLPKSV